MSGAAFDCEATNLDWKAASDALFVSDVPLFVVDSGELRNTAGIPIFGSPKASNSEWYPLPRIKVMRCEALLQ